MGQRKLWCEVVTPERITYSGEVDMVIAPGVSGELGILPLHIPIITLLDIGELRVKIGDEQEYVAIDGGFMEVREDRVTVLAESAELASQIDVERAERARERAEREIAEARAAGEDWEEAQKDLKRALTRLQVAKRTGG